MDSHRRHAIEIFIRTERLRIMGKTGGEDPSKEFAEAAANLKTNILLALESGDSANVISLLDKWYNERVQTALKASSPPINLTTVDGDTIAHIAARKGEGSIIRKIGTADHNLFKSKNNAGYSPVATAVEAGKVNVLDIFRELHASFSETIKTTGDTLTHIAAKAGQDGSLAFLEKHDLLSDKANKDSKKPQEIAVGGAKAFFDQMADRQRQKMFESALQVLNM